jgi:hypothetical protein
MSPHYDMTDNLPSQVPPTVTPDTLEPMAYVGIAECGCLRAACVDDPASKRETAKFVASLIRDGLRVETWTCQAVRDSSDNPWGCEKCRRPKGRKPKASTQTEATP